MLLKVVYQEPPKSSRQGSLFDAGVFTTTMVGASGYVREQNILTATVTVELLNGVLLRSVRVPSKTWIDETAPTVTGTVDLPPINSSVFVLLPYGMDNLTGAVVLFSVFNDRIPSQEGRLIEGEENKVVDVLSGNIRTTYDRETGNYKIEDLDDETFVIEINRENKIVHFKDWSENDVLLNADGVVLTDTNGNTATFGSGGITAVDNNGNEAILDSSGIQLNDKNGNTLVMGVSKVLVNGHLEVLQ